MKFIKQILSLFLIWNTSSGFQTTNFVTNIHKYTQTHNFNLPEEISYQKHLLSSHTINFDENNETPTEIVETPIHSFNLTTKHQNRRRNYRRKLRQIRRCPSSTATTWLNNSTKKPTPQTPYQYILQAPEVP